MASSKTLFLLISLLFALVLIVSSEVAADQTKESKKSNGVEEAKYGGPGYGYPGGGYNGGNGGGYRGYPPRRGCRYGCCRGYRYSNGCYRCCANANEAPDAVFEDDVKN